MKPRVAQDSHSSGMIPSSAKVLVLVSRPSTSGEGDRDPEDEPEPEPEPDADAEPDPDADIVYGVKVGVRGKAGWPKNG